MTRPSSNVAVFLGAGASYTFGYPLTSQILPRILDRIAQRTLFMGEVRPRRWFQKFLKILLPGISSVQPEQLPLITEILSIIDFSVGEGVSLDPFKTPEDMARFRHLLERAVYEAITSRTPSAAEDANLERFTSWLVKLRKAGKVTVISTNYDVSVDTRLFRLVQPAKLHSTFDFGFAWRQVTQSFDDEIVRLRPPSPKFRLFKLHGSLNWVRCPMCELIYVNPVGDIAPVAFVPKRSTHNSCHCGCSPLRMHIVAPSYARLVQDPNLREIWKASLQALREADEWIIGVESHRAVQPRLPRSSSPSPD